MSVKPSESQTGIPGTRTEAPQASSDDHARLRTLRQRLFASVAALALIGMVTLVEFSIRQQRTQTLESIARSAIRSVMEQPFEARRALLTTEMQSFEDFGALLLKDPDIAFARIRSGDQIDSWLITRAVPSLESSRLAIQDAHESGYRLVRRGQSRVLEVAIPLARIARQIRPQTVGAQGSVTKSGTLWVGVDATQAHANAAIAARQTRQAQALAAGLVLLGLWIVTRRALRPIEMLVENAEQLASGEEITGSVPIRSAESWRLQRALMILADPRSRSRSRQHDSRTGALDRSAPGVRQTESRRKATRYSALIPVPQTDDPTLSAGARPIRERAYRVLLVEDNPVNQTVAVHMLEELGCRVEWARDGVECVTRFDSDRFDLVFMDIQMPRMDGLEATRKIRESEAQLDVEPTPIIALTAHSQARDRAECRRVGMNGHIGKPFTQDDLEQALLEWGGSPKSAGSDGQAPNEAGGPHACAIDDTSTDAGCMRDQDEILDREAFLETMESCGSDDAFLRDLVDAFISRSRALGALCDRAIANGDREGVESAAHELKSSSGQLGAIRLQQTARELEARAAAGNANLAPIGAALLAEIELACSALREIEREENGGN